MATNQIHRTAVFTVHHPTRHVRAVLERAFRAYTDAYTTLLRAATRHDLDALRGMATYALDPKTQRPRMNARALARRLFTRDDLPPSVAAALAPLPSRLRQSVKEHVGQSLMSYVALADAHAEAEQAEQAEEAARGAQAAGARPAEPADGERAHPPPHPSRTRRAQAGTPPMPSAPSRRRRMDVEPTRRRALESLAQLADAPRRERELVADLLRTREAEPVAIPFVGISTAYGCGLYYQRENRRFYARLDVLSPKSRAARPIALRGRYVDLKTGAIYTAHASQPATAAAGAGTEGAGGADGAGAEEAEGTKGGTETFGRGCGSLLVLLAFGRYHEETLRFTRAAFLPQRGTDPRHPEPAEPAAAKLVRRIIRGEVRYQLHVSFRLPDPPPRVREEDERRPILALNRGLYHLYSAVVTSPDATQEIAPGFAASGTELLRAQAALEGARREAQRRGKAGGARPPTSTRDRRQRRIAGHHVATAANQIVEQALQHGAQVVCEDLGTFASGRALVWATRHPVRARQNALRALLNRRQFEALRRAIDARLEVAGLPPVRLVPAAGIS